MAQQSTVVPLPTLHHSPTMKRAESFREGLLP